MMTNKAVLEILRDWKKETNDQPIPFRELYRRLRECPRPSASVGSFTTLLKILRRLEADRYVGRAAHGPRGYRILPAGSRYLRAGRFPKSVAVVIRDEAGYPSDFIEFSGSEYRIHDMGSFGFIIVQKASVGDEQMKRALKAMTIGSK